MKPQAIDRITRARADLVRRDPFFGTLALHLRVARRDDVGTMATDGKVLAYNEAFVQSLNDVELIGVVAHEVMHCALRHFSRRGRRDLEEWNIAADHAINLDLRDAGFCLPRGGCLDRRFKGMSAEEIHAALYPPKPQQAADQPQASGSEGEASDNDASSSAPPPGGDDEASQGASQGQGEASTEEGKQDASQGADDTSANGQGGGSQDTSGQEGAVGQGSGTDQAAEMNNWGGVVDAGTFAEAGEAVDASTVDQEWQIYMRQAINVARKSCGRLPSWVERIADDIAAPRVDWREALRAFIDQSTVKDYTWNRPNRRHVASGLILPGFVSDSLAHLVVAIDTSGSIDDVTLQGFLAELNAALEDGAADKVTVIHVDCRIHAVEVFERGNVLMTKPKGGGGTAFAPTFEWIRENAPDASAVVYFTDLICYDFGEEPACPVMWAAWGSRDSVERYGARVPFGSVVHVA